MSGELFEEKEFEGKVGPQLQQLSQEIKQRFDQKRGFYHQLRNQYFVIDSWNELNKKLIEFDQQKFNPWNQQWANIQRTNDPNQIIQYFKSGQKFYDEMDDFIKEITGNYTHSPEIESLKSEILRNIESDILEMKTDISAQVEKGINDVLGLKAELGLQKNFQENIDEELERSTKLRNIFLGSFIISLLSIPAFLFFSYTNHFLSDYTVIEKYTLRFTYTISAGFLSYFFFGQYRLYQLISLRYSHLNGFLGGGATFISQIIGTEDSEVKKEINKRLAELFMELEEVFGLVKKNSHPADISLDKAGKIIEQLTKLAGSINKG